MLKGVGGKGKDKGKDKPEGKGKGKDKGNSAWGREHFCRSRETKDLPAHGARSLKHTGNIAECSLRAEKTTPQPSVPSTQMRGGRDARRPRA